MLLSALIFFFLNTIALPEVPVAYIEASSMEAPLTMGIKTTAKSFIVAQVSGDKEPEIFLEKNTHEVMPVASLTKLMSFIILLDDGQTIPEEVEMTASDEAEDEPDAQRIPVVKGEKVRGQDLLAVSLIYSANNAVRALVRASGLNEEAFVDRMNKKALEFGMRDTRFVDATGLSLANVSSAQDMLKLAQKAFSHEKARELSVMPWYNFQGARDGQIFNHSLLNTNKLLQGFLNKKGGEYIIQASKTGYLQESGYHFASRIARRDKEIIIVLLGSESSEARFQEAKGLAWWGLGGALNQKTNE